jgi:hypothetical protein
MGYNQDSFIPLSPKKEEEEEKKKKQEERKRERKSHIVRINQAKHDMVLIK